MICDNCRLDKTAVVTTTIRLVRTDPYSGRERTEVRTTHLCRACGGADNEEWRPA